TLQPPLPTPDQDLAGCRCSLRLQPENEKAVRKIPRRFGFRLGRGSNSRKSVKRLGSATSP
ncbi:hypothetical protein, partial [Mesorhizobium sp. M1E.F.Ca.ET.041.01.1.1]|uniref:hypothetical protein n=1 Tax=Mesorhizobium sp. M1E.F.Ca.ET.041.01.1.1 TaxID=2496759 RepID=UPI001AECCA85